MYSKSVSEFIF